MISEKIVVNGIEYTVSSTTYRGLQQAKQSLMDSIGKFEKMHPSQPLPEKAVDIQPLIEAQAESKPKPVRSKGKSNSKSKGTSNNKQI